MYQAIVLGLGFLLLFGAAYLIKSVDKAGVIIPTTVGTATTTENATSTSEKKMEGVYLCDPDTGCQNSSVLNITETGEVRMSTSFDNGVEVIQETGTWKSEKDGSVSILLTGTDSEVYPIPHTLLVKYVSSSSLSGITFDARAYEGWTRPVFRKQIKEE